MIQLKRCTSFALDLMSSEEMGEERYIASTLCNCLQLKAFIYTTTYQKRRQETLLPLNQPVEL